MIAKYPALCRYCRKPIEVGKDEYDIETKTNFHWACHDNPQPTPECYAIAERLGFVDSGGAGTVAWSRICADRALRNLPKAHRGDSVGRTEAKAPAQRDATLFGE